MDKNGFSQPTPPLEQQSETQPQEPTVPQPEKKKTTKWLFIGLGLITFISLGAVGIFAWQNYQLKQKETTADIAPQPTTAIKASPTTNPTADWKTYTNKKYGYEIRYPKDWTVAAKGGLDPYTFEAPFFSNPCNYEAGDRCTDLMIDVLDNYKNTSSPEDYFNFSFDSKWPDKIIKKQQIKLDGKEALQIEYYQGNYFHGTGEDETGMVFLVIKAIYNNMVYSLTFAEDGKDWRYINTSGDWQYKDVFDQILSTFKFIPSAGDQTTLNKGKVEGKICYPSDYVPEGYILAKKVDTGQVEKTYFEGVPPNNQEYSIVLDAGIYVFAYDPGGHGLNMGFWTPCAPTMHVDNCSTPESHRLTEVNVVAGKTVSNIDLCDYYYQPEEKPDF